MKHAMGTRASLSSPPGTAARRTTLIVVALVAAGLLGASTLDSLSPADLIGSVLAGDPRWLAVSALLYALGHLLSGLVWRRGLSAADLDSIPLGRVLRAHWLARGASELLPAQLGEAVRLAVLRGHGDADRHMWRVAGTVAAYKGVDGLSSILVALAVLTFFAASPALDPTGLVLLGGAAALLVVLALLARPLLRLAQRLLPQRARRAGEELVHGGRVLVSGRYLVPVLGLQSLIIVTRVVSVGALLAAYGVPVEAAPVVFSLIILAGLLPITPGGAGVREMALVPVLVASFGLDVETALAVSLASQACALAISLLGAAVAAAAGSEALQRHLVLPPLPAGSPLAPTAPLPLPLKARPAG